MNKSNPQTILDAIAKALNSGSNDVTVVAISIAAVILFFIVLSLIISGGNKRNIKKTSISAYHKLIRRYNLSILEIDLIDELAKALREPEKKYLLLVNSGTFRYAIQKLIGLNEEKIAVIDSLSDKLGFASGIKHQNAFSTNTLKPGLPAKIESSVNKVFAAEINSVSESGIIIKYFSDDDRIAVGEEVKLIICFFDGFKVYILKALKVKDNLFSAAHTEAEKIGKTKVKLKVIIKREKDEQSEPGSTMAVLIAEKGAVLLNTPDRLKPGDDIRIFLDNDKKLLRHVNAEVIKAPITSKLVTVKFTHLNN